MTGGFRSRAGGGHDARKTGKSNQGKQRNRKTTNSGGRARQPRDSRHRGEYVDPARLVAFETVRQVADQDAYANLVLPKAMKAKQLNTRDAAFATELTYGTLRTLGVVDHVIAFCSSRPLHEMDKGLLDALRLGVYQLLYMRVDTYAAVDTTVRLVSRCDNGQKLTGFANAVMRQASRMTAEDWLRKLAPAGEIAGLAFKHAHPEWIAQSFARVLGLGELAEALEADSARPLVHLAARPGEITAEELALVSGGEKGRYSPYAVYLNEGDPGKLEAVRDRLAQVQDEGSQIIARATSVAPVSGPDRGRWLDLCAGPGGKSALLGALAAIDGATVHAVEVQPHRAELVQKACSGLPVTVHCADGRHLNLEPGFDRVLVDAPCSGLGSLRRRPEARWRKKEADIAQLNILQYELLSEACRLTRPGGIIIYSTCSPDQRETRGIVDKALSHFAVTEVDAKQFACGMTDTGDGLSVQMWPHRHGTDAMFFAVLQKQS